MPDPVIQARTAALTEDDRFKRGIVEELLKSQSERIVGFAKHLVTVSFSAIGVVLTLKEKWLGPVATPRQQLLLGVAIGCYLAGALVATLAVSAYAHKATLADYDDVDVELNRVARLRQRLTRAGFLLTVIATTIVAYTAI